MQNKRKGAVLIEVLVALFITGIVFIGVYTTISVSLINMSINALCFYNKARGVQWNIFFLG